MAKDGHCDTEDRDYDTIVKTALIIRPALVDPDAWLRDVEAYGRLGITEVMTMPDRHPVEFANGIAKEILPRLP